MCAACSGLKMHAVKLSGPGGVGSHGSVQETWCHITELLAQVGPSALPHATLSLVFLDSCLPCTSDVQLFYRHHCQVFLVSGTLYVHKTTEDAKKCLEVEFIPAHHT